MTPIEEEEEEYLKTLSEKERKAYEIAKDHLGSSFDLVKSNGFLKWKKEKESTKTL
jgi:competence protein ComGC